MWYSTLSILLATNSVNLHGNGVPLMSVSDTSGGTYGKYRRLAVICRVFCVPNGLNFDKLSSETVEL